MTALDPSTLDLASLPCTTIDSLHILPSAPALYFVIGRRQEIRYIGRATNIHKRWKSHHRLHSYKTETLLTVAWLVVSEPDLLPALEAACIAYFDPIDNGKEYDKPPSQANIEQLTVRFPKGLLEILRQSAEANDRSLNAEIVNAVRVRARAFAEKKEMHEPAYS